MTEQRPGGDDIVLVTNVGPTILRSYFAPLAALDEVARLTIVRDKDFPRFGRNVEWCDTSTSSGNAGLRVIKRIIRCGALIRRRIPVSLMVMHWFPDGFWVFPIARALGIPVIAHIVGGKAEIDSGARKLALSPAPRVVKRVAQVLTRRMFDQISVVTFTGRTTRGYFHEVGVRRPRLCVVHPSVQCDDRPNALADRPIDIVYVGRVDADKRFDRFLRVLAEIGGDREELRVRVCGVSPADVSADAATRAVTLPASVRVEYLGHVPDVRPHLRLARIFMLSSDSEGLSLAMLEAMGCGTVPIVTDVGDLGSALAESGGGVAVGCGPSEERIVAAMTAAAKAILDSADEWARLSRIAHAHVRERHSVQATQADWRLVMGYGSGDEHTPARAGGAPA